MTMTFGSRDTFAIEVGDYIDGSDNLRTVDIWAGNHYLTCDDNDVYVPQFVGSILYDLELLRAVPGQRYTQRPFPKKTFAENLKFLLNLPEDIEQDDGSRFDYLFMQWGPTVDNISALLFREIGIANLVFQFWRDTHSVADEKGEIFTVSIPEQELVNTLSEAAKYLDSSA